MVVEITATEALTLLGIGLLVLEVKQVELANFAGVGWQSWLGRAARAAELETLGRIKRE